MDAKVPAKCGVLKRTRTRTAHLQARAQQQHHCQHLARGAGVRLKPTVDADMRDSATLVESL